MKAVKLGFSLALILLLSACGGGTDDAAPCADNQKYLSINDAAPACFTSCTDNSQCELGEQCNVDHGICLVGDNNANPGDNNANPGDNNANPGDNNANPGDNNANPGDNNANPGDNNANPGDNNANPGDNNANPGDNNANPGDNNANPGDNNANPGDNNANPGDNNANPGGGKCADHDFSGQIGGDGLHEGGSITTTAYATDAGLQGLMDAIDPVENGSDAQTFDVPVEIRGAIVVATAHEGFGNRRFWVQDSNTAIQFYLPHEINDDHLGLNMAMDGIDVRVGQIVNFDVLETQVFDGHPQISLVENMQVVSSENAVPVVDFVNQDVTMSAYGKAVRIAGELGPNPVACGGSAFCYDLIYGENGDKTTTLRSASDLLVPGQCVAFVGPLGAFPGPKNDAGTSSTVQFDTINYDWLYFWDL